MKEKREGKTEHEIERKKGRKESKRGEKRQITENHDRRGLLFFLSFFPAFFLSGLGEAERSGEK